MGNKTIKILTVDDNRDNLTTLKALITDIFPEAAILTAVNGSQALALAAAEEPDVILLDIIMPGMDGFEVCTRLKEDGRLCDIPIVFITAIKSDKESRIRALECGAEAFLTKPIDLSELTAQIRAMLKIRMANLQKRDEQERLTLLVEEKTRDLEKSKKNLEAAQKISHIGSWEYNILTKTSDWSDEVYRILNLVPRSVEPGFETYRQFIHPKDRDSVTKAYRDAARNQVSHFNEHRLLLNHSTIKHIRYESEVLFDAQGNPKSMHGIIADITQRKESENKLLYLSYHDHLTGLYNRRFFEEQLRALDTEGNLPLTIIMYDINGLKLINDSFRYDLGDVLLKKTAETMTKGSRQGDIIARIGGDEFVILLPKTDAAEAIQIANRIKDLASKVKVANIELSISYGQDTKTNIRQSIAEVLANAENNMYKHKLYERSSMRSKTIDIIMNTLFEKSSRESLHSTRVSKLCQTIAARMDFDEDRINQIRIAGLIHDIGKIGIDEKILNKEGSLDSEERKQVYRHPEIGWRILSSTNEFSELSQFVLGHHEKWDGSGYPNGLKGSEIPLEARIIAVADAYDAMTSKRSYQKGISKSDAVLEMKRCAGTHFDPDVVRIFIQDALGEE